MYLKSLDIELNRILPRIFFVFVREYVRIRDEYRNKNDPFLVTMQELKNENTADMEMHSARSTLFYFTNDFSANSNIFVSFF